MATSTAKVEAPAPSSSVDATSVLQSAFNARMTQADIEKLAKELNVTVNVDELKAAIAFRDSPQGGLGSQFQTAPATPAPAPETPSLLTNPNEAAIARSQSALEAARSIINEEPSLGLDPQNRAVFEQMGPVGRYLLAPIGDIGAGILTGLTAGAYGGAVGVGEGLKQIGALDAWTKLTSVKQTPERFAEQALNLFDVTGMHFPFGLRAGLPEVAPVTVPRAVALDPLANLPAAPRIAEVAAEITPPPTPRIPTPKAAPKVELPSAPVAAEAAAIPVAEADVARAAKTLEDFTSGAVQEAPLVDKAGNLNLSKFDTTDDVKKLIDTVAQTNDQFLEARRGVMSVNEINKLADKTELEDILGRSVGQTFNAEQLVAARRAVNATAEDVFNVAREYAATGDQNLRTKALEAVVRQTAFQEQLAGATAEAGRALRMLREVQGSDRSRAVEKIVGQFTDITDPEKIDDFLRKISTLNSPEAVAKFVGEAVKPGFGDKISELWINGLLAGPTTHAVNITSNALTSVMDLPEQLLASAFGKVLRSPDRVTLGEVGARTTGIIQGSKDGLKLFAEALRTGDAADAAAKVDYRKSISGVKGEIIRTPTRLLTAQDELFKAINGRQELAAQAYVKAKAEAGGDVAEMNRLYKNYLENPTKDMLEAATKHARLMTFQAPLGKWGSKIQEVTKVVWPLRFIAPFIATPTNILKHALRRSPLAPLSKGFWQDVLAGGRVRDKALAQVTLGSAIAGAFAALAEAGVVTGSGPSDPKQRAALMATGWQPYSIKWRDKYYQYGRLEPLAMSLGMAADYATLSNFMQEKDLVDAGSAITLSIAKNLTSKTYLQGISDFMEMVSDPDRYGESYVQNFISSFVPNVGGATARALDPTIRDTSAETFFGELKNRVQSRVPGLSDNLPSRLDPWGDPITRTGFAQPTVGGFTYNILSPVKVSEVNRSSPAKTEVARLNMTVGYPDKNITIAGKNFPLSPDLHRRFGYASGQMAKMSLDEIVKTDAYKKLDDEAKRKVVRQIFEMSRDQYRDAVKYEFMVDYNRKIDEGK